MTIPATMLTVFFLLGIEELGLQIEEPFGILPMEAFCDGAIGAALNEMVSPDRFHANLIPLPSLAPRCSGP